ncbi:MAG: hypothetical protein Q8823_01485, partial [Candidatus Phytoplasma australasiaticum]|nr:hypothetical protein [Candidatus Phytoplasma australasiaticum]
CVSISEFIFLIFITNSLPLNRTSKFPSIRLAIICPFYKANLVLPLVSCCIINSKLLTSFAL